MHAGLPEASMLEQMFPIPQQMEAFNHSLT